VTLTAVKPDKEVIDALLLDAAWEHAKDLEVQVANLRRLLVNANKAWRQQTEKHTNLKRELWDITEKYKLKVEGNPDLAEIVTDLTELQYKGE
jgi:hypothetical protein